MKRFTAILLVFALCFSFSLTAFAADSAEAEKKAEALSTLGLFKGTGDGFELDRQPTRMEALILLIRLLGKENEALDTQATHPFTDSPSWYGADQYLAYGYEKGLTTGVTATEFQPNEPASAQMMVTFVLRALGYTDGQTPGSVWNNWEELGQKAGILSDGVDTKNFLRADAVLVLYRALSSEVQGLEIPTTLGQHLIDQGVFTQYQLDAARVQAGAQVNLKTSSLASIMAAVYEGVDADLSHFRTQYTQITQDNLSYYLGVEELNFTEGLASEPMMLAQAHSVCLVRVADGVDVEKTCQAIAESVNPQKWICVGVSEEGIRTASVGNLILLVMDNTYAQDLVDSFLALES